MIRITSVASGREYTLGKLAPGELQYADREYRFAYVPEKLEGCPMVVVHGNDKMLPEDSPCFTLETSRGCTAYILYPDKQPVIPGWLEGYTRVRMNVTRTDSDPKTLKGWFSLYEKHFPAGEIVFWGNSPKEMLQKDWYLSTGGTNYCMYSVALLEDPE